MDVEEFDYVIVGAGSAGCALAARLTESGQHTVLLLEAGPSDDSLWIHLPLGVGKLLNNERYAWKFETEPQVGMGGKRVYSPRGKVLGGSSSINGMAYIWGDPAEFDRWRDAGNEGWGFDDVRPYFQRLESNLFSDNPGRGRNGPVHITDRKFYDRDVLSDSFVEACRMASIPETADYNAGSYEGVRYLEQTAHRGRRCSTSVAYLREARRRENLKIKTEALASRVIWKRRRAVGVEYLQQGTKRTARARIEVVLAAGAIKSPQLLELSGVGDGDRLCALGIPVVAHRPAVGEHMVDHIQLRCTYRTNVPITINDVMRSPWHRLRFGLQYLTTRRGLLAGTSSTAHAITRTSEARGRPDVMVRIYHISGKDRFSRSPEAGIDPFSGFSIGGFKLHPVSRGSVHISSTDPHAAPSIDPRYLVEEADCRTAVALLRLIRRIAHQPPLQQVIVAESRPGPDVDDDDALLQYARDTGQTAWHTIGSCRMGNVADSVVDARLRVHGVEGLRVVDASIMPTIASSNTNAAAIMIGERGADLILADARQEQHQEALICN
jgi:choline dehydrogenase